jgi:hypothetical protein
MSGSDAPRLALARLGHLAGPLETIGQTAALAALERDPLAALAAGPLDDGVLEALLARLTGTSPAGSGSRLVRRQQRPGRRAEREPGRPAEARALARHRVETLSREMPHTSSRQVSERRSAPEPVERLARLARRVAAAPPPVDALAASLPSYPEATSGLESAPAALDAVLHRLTPAFRPFSEPAPEPPLTAAETGAPGVGSSTGPATSHAAAPAARTGEPVARGPRRIPRPPAARADLLPPRPHALADLVRRWQDDRVEPEETAGPAPRPEAAGAGGTADSQGLAVALEHLLLGELRRHGIEVEVG